jgi:hypothetical protein
MIKMCCFVILTDKNFVNNYFNVFKNIDFHCSTLTIANYKFKIQIEWLTSVLLVYTIANGLDVFLKYMGIFTFHILTHLQLETV